MGPLPTDLPPHHPPGLLQLQEGRLQVPRKIVTLSLNVNIDNFRLGLLNISNRNGWGTSVVTTAL